MIPAFVNDAAGTAPLARAALEEAGAFDVRETEPGALARVLRDEVAMKPRRIAVAGGDGTLATAAAAVCDTGTELAMLPGGTLNHFARDHGIPTDFHDAAQVAATGASIRTDVGYLDDQLFLNTSSVGAYVTFVRMRERLERYLPYRLASLAAALRLLASVRPIQIELEVEGVTRRYSTPLVFIGVGERELKSPEFGGRVPGGEHRLHVIVVRERRAARLAALAIEAATQGLERVARTPDLDSFLVDCCTVGVPGRHVHVSLDGEITRRRTPMHYRIARDAISIVVPATTVAPATTAPGAPGAPAAPPPEGA